MVDEMEVIQAEKQQKNKADKKVAGLKSMRAGVKSGGSRPTIKCENCDCMRFNPCGCTVAKDKEKKVVEVV